MSGKVDRHRDAYQKFFDAINEGVWEKIESLLRELATPDFILHTIGKPEKDTTLEETLEDFKRGFGNFSSRKIAFVNCFSVGDMMAAHVNYETTEKETNEKRTQELIWVDRYEGDKIAEEWVW
jgi:hypothetical protein